MCSRILRLRVRAFARQSGRCFYCDLPMWADSRLVFCEGHGLSPRQARQFECTAEHLQAKRDGGGNGVDNIVASCRHCNATRHRRKVPLAPDQWRTTQRRRAERRWPRSRLNC